MAINESDIKDAVAEGVAEATEAQEELAEVILDEKIAEEAKEEAEEHQVIAEIREEQWVTKAELASLTSKIEALEESLSKANLTTQHEELVEEVKEIVEAPVEVDVEDVDQREVQPKKQKFWMF